MNTENLTDAKPKTDPSNLRELLSLFLRLGTTAFGGPAAHIAMMEDEVGRPPVEVEIYPGALEVAADRVKGW